MRKALLINSLVLIGVISIKGQLTQTENYVSSINCLEADCTKKAWSVEYLDGLGRPKQIINVKASANGDDIATSMIYDDYGRKTSSWLPAPLPSKDGGIQNGVQTAAVSFYADPRPFAEKVLDKSPLDRINQQIAPGETWQHNPLKYQYQSNAVSDNVLKFSVITAWIDGATHSTLTKATYASNSLYKTVVVDEDGNMVTEFRNGRGQTILVRKSDGLNNVDTYYVYNQYNQLVFIVPPLAAVSPSITSDVADYLCYQYRYDKEGRMVEKKLPGKGWEYMVYDKSDRLILHTDTSMLQKGKWLFTKYDNFGRVLYTGITSGTSRFQLQDEIKNLVITESRSSNGFNANGITAYYSKNFYTDIDTLLTVNYYDTYPAGTPTKPTQIFNQGVLSDDSQSSTNTKSMAVATYIKNMEDDRWTINYNWYDKNGKTVATHLYNHLGGYTKTEFELDFAGVPQKTYTYHKRISTDAEIQIRERFEYNPNSLALEKHYHEVVGKTPEELLAENSYDEIGRLTSKKTGNNLQSIDYAYNIRSWMTGINLDAAGNFQAGKLFNYKINYNGSNLLGSQTPNSDHSHLKVIPRFNGNIAEVQWNSGKGNKVYGYVYDGVNRLLAGLYQEPGTPDLKTHSEIISYDLNGNIDRLKRSGYFIGTSALLIDDLKYHYQGNRVSSIDDQSSNSSGYEGGGAAISYDDNGNMTTMPDKGISAIAYNHLNLPRKISITPGSQASTVIKTAYRADGTKITKENATTMTGVVGTTTTTDTTDYLDGFQYFRSKKSSSKDQPAYDLETSLALEREAFTVEQKRIPPPGIQQDQAILQFMPTAEGFYDFIEKKYIYQYKDHLGNVRLSYARNAATQTPDVLDRNDYYPFGMNHLNPLTEDALFGKSSYKNYKYNGKELQETGMYDYGARFYMPDIGRWGTTDPLAEAYFSHSPYAYVMNNPILFFDPNGMLSQSFMDEIFNSPSGTTWTNNGNGFSNNWGGMMDYQGNPTNYVGYSFMASGGTGGTGGGGGGLPTVTLPTVYLTGSSSGWGQQIQSQFNSYMNSWNAQGGFSNILSNTSFLSNTAIGLGSTANIPRTGVFKYNDIWHQTKTRGTSFTWQNKWKNPGAKYWRGQQVKGFQGARSLGTKLTYAGGALLVADVAMSGQVKPSHIINGAMLGASMSGVGSIVAGAWFIVDIGTGGVNYLSGNGFTTLSDVIDQSEWGQSATFDMYDGLY